MLAPEVKSVLHNLLTLIEEVRGHGPLHDVRQQIVDLAEGPSAPKPDAYAGKTADELLELARGGDAEALERYAEAVRPKAATTEAAPAS